MSHPVSWFDRLRIESVVWSLDHRLYDLSPRSRIAKRREVRENLLTASADIGTSEALRNLGGSRRLAAEYRAAEFDGEVRANWFTAFIFFMTGQLLIQSLLTERVLAFNEGLMAANPDATGTFTSSRFSFIQDAATFTLDHGQGVWTGGRMTVWAWVVFAVATILVGRLWRAVPGWRRLTSAKVI
ncbi:hypothetical protein AB0M43_08450 [Longispora sp. NPDC051575]|uniref:hypothetical protein n=1 Tax=Longispora sp. NPDC051575 TaxID=3154943 RepID=UPI003418F734